MFINPILLLGITGLWSMSWIYGLADLLLTLRAWRRCDVCGVGLMFETFRMMRLKGVRGAQMGEDGSLNKEVHTVPRWRTQRSDWTHVEVWTKWDLCGSCLIYSLVEETTCWRLSQKLHLSIIYPSSIHHPSIIHPYIYHPSIIYTSILLRVESW